jgi:hypothetical protein
MKIDKDTLLSLLRQHGEQQKANAAESELPSEIDTDKPEHKDLLGRLGIDPSMLGGLVDKLPDEVKSKLPGGVGKLLD